MKGLCSLVCSCLLLLMCIFLPQQCRAGQEEALEMSPNRFSLLFNSYAKDFGLPRMPVTPQKKDKNERAVVHSYFLSNTLVIQYHLLPENTDKLRNVIFIGTGDGTEQSGQAMLLGAMAFVAALTPDMNSDQRGQLLKLLGLLPLEVVDGKPRGAVYGALRIQSSYSQKTGMLLVASPAKKAE